VNILNKRPRTNDKVWSSSLGVGRGAKKNHENLMKAGVSTKNQSAYLLSTSLFGKSTSYSSHSSCGFGRYDSRKCLRRKKIYLT
jgi:hypothetical protein